VKIVSPPQDCAAWRSCCLSTRRHRGQLRVAALADERGRSFTRPSTCHAFRMIPEKIIPEAEGFHESRVMPVIFGLRGPHGGSPGRHAAHAESRINPAATIAARMTTILIRALLVILLSSQERLLTLSEKVDATERKRIQLTMGFRMIRVRGRADIKRCYGLSFFATRMDS
jgi:hypothetical protein